MTSPTIDSLRAETYAALAFALINVPTRDTETLVERLGEAAGLPCAPNGDREALDSGALEQELFDRTVVPSSPTYVPLFEQAVRGAERRGEVWRFPAVTGSHSLHVERCYRRVGFEYRNLAGQPEIVASLHADSLAVECAFMAFLLLSDDGCARVRADQFLKQHLGCWVEKAAVICSERSDDRYARIVRLCALYAKADALQAP